MKYLHDQTLKMEEASFILKHDRHNFVSLLDEFRLKELFCDATIACDGKKYPVHQVVLSACSDFFADIFASERCQNPLILLQDVSSLHLENLLSYIYTGEVHIPHKELPTFLKTAKSLFVKGLMIPNLEKYADSDSISGTWHEPYLPSGKAMARFYASEAHSQVNAVDQFPYASRSFPRDNSVHHNYQENYPSLIHPQIPASDIRPDDGLGRQLLEHAQLMGNRGQILRQQKQLSDVIDYPQDLRVSPHRSSQDSPTTGKDESLSVSKYSVAETREDGISPKCLKDDKDYLQKNQSIPANEFVASESKGTFRELVSSDEFPIKKEPEDIIICDAKEDLDTVDNGNSDKNDDEMEEETSLKISEDREDAVFEETVVEESFRSSPKSSDDSKDITQLREDLSTSREASLSPQGNMSPSSQLRRELLRPITSGSHSFSQHHYQKPGLHTTPPISIPHPVIAMRDSHVKQPSNMRGPPPLMKLQTSIPTVIEESNNIRNPACKVVKSMPVSRSNNHLLVSAPPTYRSSNFSFEIHNQQLGPVLVNGGAHIALTSHSAFRQDKPQQGSTSNNISNDSCKVDFMYDCDTPLNLSGFQDPFAKRSRSPSNNGDPFLGKIVTNRKKRLRGPKSWEFLVRLLKDPTTNPDLIRWENESNGIFRLVKPALIAQRWGRRTGKHASENLSYENFARGLRYHYATGALKPVSEKSFVYKFGPKALKVLNEGDFSMVYPA